MDLPQKQKVFDFDFTAELGKKYEGQFTVLCRLNIAQKHAMELEKTRLLGNYANPTDELAGLAIVLSTLRAKIIDSPEWWKQSLGGAALEDEDVLSALYRKVQDSEAEWKNEMLKKAQPAKTDEKNSQ